MENDVLVFSMLLRMSRLASRMGSAAVGAVDRDQIMTRLASLLAGWAGWRRCTQELVVIVVGAVAGGEAEAWRQRSGSRRRSGRGGTGKETSILQR